MVDTLTLKPAPGQTEKTDYPAISSGNGKMAWRFGWKSRREEGSHRNAIC